MNSQTPQLNNDRLTSIQRVFILVKATCLIHNLLLKTKYIMTGIYGYENFFKETKTPLIVCKTTKRAKEIECKGFDSVVISEPSQIPANWKRRRLYLDFNEEQTKLFKQKAGIRFLYKLELETKEEQIRKEQELKEKGQSAHHANYDIFFAYEFEKRGGNLDKNIGCSFFISDLIKTIYNEWKLIENKAQGSL